VLELRQLVAAQAAQAQLDFYVAQAAANPAEEWLDFVRPEAERGGGGGGSDDDDDSDDGDDSDDDFSDGPGGGRDAGKAADEPDEGSRGARARDRTAATAAEAAAAAAAPTFPPQVTDVGALRALLTRCGGDVGAEGCIWADDFAFSVVAQAHSLLILFLDMERPKAAWPFRVLAGAGGGATRLVVLRRMGPVGHFVYLAPTAPGKAACWPVGSAPAVVKALWGLG